MYNSVNSRFVAPLVHSQTARQTDRQTVSQTVSQTDRQADRKVDSQADRDVPWVVDLQGPCAWASCQCEEEASEEEGVSHAHP